MVVYKTCRGKIAWRSIDDKKPMLGKRDEGVALVCIYCIHVGQCTQRKQSYRLGLQGQEIPETLYHRDDALLYIAYVMLIWAAPIRADRWHCSLQP